MKYQILYISSMKNIVSTLLLCLFSLTNACYDDNTCSDCQIIPIGFGPGGLYVAYVCYECVSTRYLDDYNQCICSKGYYQNDQTNCPPCKETCSVCQSKNECVVCAIGYNRVLSEQSCICQEGYQQAQASNVCKKKKNILTIVLSAVGSTICLVFSSIICIYLRMRRGGSHQVHDNKKRNGSGNIEVEIYQGYDSTYPMQNSTVLWNSKHTQYKTYEICSICLDQSPYFMTECGHYFHPKCIYSWLQKKTACPNCNQEITIKQIRRWCEKCLKVLMPVVRNVIIKKIGRNGKRKKQLVQSTPVQHQYCENCENESSEQESISAKNQIQDNQGIKN